MNLDQFIDNPSKSETYNKLEETIANQMARFTSMMTNSKDQTNDFTTVCALGFDLWKTCGPRVCEDTNMILTHIVRKSNPDMADQFQQIANRFNNNDVCTYLYLALPTINYNLSKESIKQLCYNTIEKISLNHKEVRYPFQPNFKAIDINKTKELYNQYLNELI